MFIIAIISAYLFLEDSYAAVVLSDLTTYNSQFVGLNDEEASGCHVCFKRTFNIEG